MPGRIRLRLVLGLALLLTVAAQTGRAGESRPIAWPEPDKASAVNGLVLQLAAEQSRVVFPTRVWLWARFVNVSEEPIILLLGSVPGREVYVKRKLGMGSSYARAPTTTHQLLRLEPGAAFAVAVNEVVPGVGKQLFGVAYESPGPDTLDGLDIWHGEITSNVVTLTALPGPLSEARQKSLRAELDRLLEWEKGMHDRSRSGLMGYLIATYPYSRPIIEKALVHDSWRVRMMAVGVIRGLASKDATDRPVVPRATDMWPVLLRQLARETQVGTGQAMIMTLRGNIDTLDESERKQAIFALELAITDPARRHLRDEAAVPYLALTGDKGKPLVKRYLRPDRYADRTFRREIKERFGLDLPGYPQPPKTWAGRAPCSYRSWLPLVWAALGAAGASAVIFGAWAVCRWRGRRRCR